MKRRLNILCLLVILVLGYSVFDSIYQLGSIMVSGYEAGRQAVTNGDDNQSEFQKMKNMQPVAVFPDHFPVFTDSVFNAKTGEYIPMIHSQMLVSQKTELCLWQKIVAKLASFTNIFAVLFAIYLFIRLIVSMNKSVIFDWKNVRRLRWLGISLIVCFVCEAIPMCITYYALSDAFALKDYTLHFSEFITITNLVLGLSALLVGEVFAIGLKMKEEQELTI